MVANRRAARSAETERNVARCILMPVEGIYPQKVPWLSASSNHKSSYGEETLDNHDGNGPNKHAGRR